MFSFFKKQKHTDDELVAVVKGRMFPIEEVKDDVFSGKMMGDGVAFSPEEDEICAPVNGELTAVFPTGHAFGIRRPDGVEILVHIGLDTVNLDGEGFKVCKKQGCHVQAGDVIVRVDRKLIQEKGYDISTMVIVTEAAGKDIIFTGYGPVERECQIIQ